MNGEQKRRLDIVHEIYDAFGRGDLDTVMRHVADDAVVTQDGALPWGGRFVGRDGVAEFALGLVGTIASAVTAEAVFAAGDQVVEFGRTRGTVVATGAAFDVPECHIWTFRGETVVAADFFIDSPAMLAALSAPGTSSDAANS